jgi:hypothetical protein
VRTLLEHPFHYAGTLWNGTLPAEERTVLGLENHYNSGLLRSPTYVLFLGFVYLAGDHDLALVGAVQSFLVGLTVFVTCLVAAQLLGLWPALAAGALAATYASFAYYTPMVLTETLALFLLTATVALLVQVHTRAGAGWAFGLGVAVVFLGLCRITYQFLIPVLVVTMAWNALRRGEGRRLVLFLLGVAVVLGPWLLFSARVYGKPLLAAPRAETAYAIYRGNYAPEDGWENDGAGDYWSPELRDAVQAGDNGGVLNEAAYLDAWKRTVQADPPRYSVFVLRKACRLWAMPACGWSLDLGWGRLPGQVGWHRILVVLGVLGLGLALRDPGRFWYVPLLLFYITGIHALTHVENRFAVPFMPLVITLTVALVSLPIRARGRIPLLIRRRSVQGALAALVILPVLSGFLNLGRLTAVFGAEHLDVLRAAAVLVRLSPLAAGAWLFFSLFRPETGRRRALAAGLVPAAVMGIACAGSAWGNPAWREWSCRLSAGSQAVVQEILLPKNVNWNLVRTAALQIDMLPDIGSRTPVEILVDGTVVRTYPHGLEPDTDKFLYEERIQGKRWDHLYRMLNEVLDEVNPGGDVGLEYFRQWYVIPVDTALVLGKERIRVEVRLGEGEGNRAGGGIEVFGDYADAAGSGERAFFGPAFGRTLYETSTYKLRLTAGVRRDDDYRLYRKYLLGSTGTVSTFMEEGKPRDGDLSPGPGRQAGEYRIRLDLGLAGGYYSVTDPDTDEMMIGWTLEPSGDMVPAGGPALRALQSQKDIFFDGHIVF